MTNQSSLHAQWRFRAAVALTSLLTAACMTEAPATDEATGALVGRVSRPTHHEDDGSCGPGTHMCCDSVGQFECLTDSPVGANLCPPGFDEPCDGEAPPPSQCGPGNHACCETSGQVQCLVDAPPGMLNLCPPLTEPC
jgi:hypothetical protein